MFGLGVDQRVTDFRAVAVFAVADDVEHEAGQGVIGVDDAMELYVVVDDDAPDSLEVHAVCTVLQIDGVRVQKNRHGVELQIEADRVSYAVLLLILGVEDDSSRFALFATPSQFANGNGSFHVLIDLQLLLPPYSR